MRELSIADVQAVSGGWELDPMDVAITYSSTVMSAGIGLTVGGPLGGIAGAAIGFGMGLAMSIGYSMASSSSSYYYNDGRSCINPRAC